MKVQCQGCQSWFNVSNKKIPKEGKWINCPKCAKKIFIKGKIKTKDKNSLGGRILRIIEAKHLIIITFLLIITVSFQILAVELWIATRIYKAKYTHISEKLKIMERGNETLNKENKDLLKTQANLKSKIANLSKPPPKSDSPPSRLSASEQSNIGWHRIVSGNYVGSYNRSDYEKAINFSVSGDYAALQELLLSGRIFPLETGTEVFLEDYSIFGGWIKVRPRGSVVSFYTSASAID